MSRITTGGVVFGSLQNLILDMFESNSKIARITFVISKIILKDVFNH